MYNVRLFRIVTTNSPLYDEYMLIKKIKNKKRIHKETLPQKKKWFSL
jgi:hypothetical protein